MVQLGIDFTPYFSGLKFYTMNLWYKAIPKIQKLTKIFRGSIASAGSINAIGQN